MASSPSTEQEEDSTVSIRAVFVKEKYEKNFTIEATQTIKKLRERAESYLQKHHSNYDKEIKYIVVLSYRGREEILSENKIVSDYPTINNADAVILLKEKPILIHVNIRKRVYIDANATSQQIIPLIHYALARHEWTEGKQILTQNDQEFTKSFNKEENSVFYLQDTTDSEPLNACEPTPLSEFIKKSPKRKSLSYLHRNKDALLSTSNKDGLSSSTSAISPIAISVDSSPKSSPDLSRQTLLREPSRSAVDRRKSTSPRRKGVQSVPQPQSPLLSPKRDDEFRFMPLHPDYHTESDEDKLRRRKSIFMNFRRTDSLLLRVSGSSRSRDSNKLSDGLSLSPRDSAFIPVHLQNISSVDDGKRFYGIPVEAVMSRPSEKANPAPSIILQMAAHLLKTDALAEEGIFRLCATHDVINSLITQFDSGEPVDLTQYDSHGIANAFKLYFQLLPEPILTYDLYPRFMAAVCLEDESMRNDYYNALFSTVSPLRQQLCIYLISFLRKIAQRNDTNKMGSKNLGIIFGPLLLQGRPSEKDFYLSYMHYSKYVIKCASHFVDSFEHLFVDVPPVDSVRAINSYQAKKHSELDVHEGSVIHIFKRGEEECLGESDGRFGTLPTHFLYDSDGHLKFEKREETSSSGSPRVRRVSSKVKSIRRKRANSNGEAVSPGSGVPLKAKSKVNLEDEVFLKTFLCTKEIFSLLPKWKQDAMLRQVGLLDSDASESTSPGEPAAVPQSGPATQRNTIPVGPAKNDFQSL